jgi:hypothetical protein
VRETDSPHWTARKDVGAHSRKARTSMARRGLVHGRPTRHQVVVAGLALRRGEDQSTTGQPTSGTLSLSAGERPDQCRTPDLALNSMRLDCIINEAQVGTRVFHLLGIQIFAKSDESLLRSVIGQAVETHPQFMALVIRDNIAG